MKKTRVQDFTLCTLRYALCTILYALCAMPSALFATPFLICDPQTGVDHYVLTGPSWVATNVPAQADGSIRMDVAAAAVGANSLTVKACNSWGECSVSVPFSFTRPVAPAITSNIRLTQ